MWAWLGQRLSAVFALGLVTYHYFDPINQRAQNALMAFVVFHAILGLRVILLDLGLRDRYNKVALYVLACLGVVIITAGVLWNR
jgi:succinate dehydrogenase / fumarate reductase cytochrome b subunit